MTARGMVSPEGRTVGSGSSVAWGGAVWYGDFGAVVGFRDCGWGAGVWVVRCPCFVREVGEGVWDGVCSGEMCSGKCVPFYILGRFYLPPAFVLVRKVL